MAFRRPKKPIRPRVVMLNADSDEDIERMDVDSPPLSTTKEKQAPSKNNGHGGGGKLSFNDDVVVTFNKPKNTSNKKDRDRGLDDGEEKPSKSATLLSFDDDLDGEEEEIFQVKKSSVSRRLMKQRVKEKKGSGSERSSSKSSKNPFGSSSTNLEEAKSKFQSQVDGFVSQIKIKQEPIVVKKEFNRILNGREAEALHMESDDEEDEDEDGGNANEENGSASGYGHKFRRPAPGGGAAIQDAVRRALEQGQIPDANLIHEARKRKQMARDMGGGAEFVPVDNVDRLKKEKGRLVREDDDNDQSDEERLDFSSATNAEKIDREKRIEDFNNAQGLDSDNDSDGELDEWESQQIRKGVSQAKMHNVAKERFQQVYLDSNSPHQLYNSNQEAAAGFSFYPQLPSSEPKKKGKTQAFMEQTQKIASIEEVVGGSKKITPELILKQMSDRLQRLKLSRDRNAGELCRVEADMNLAVKELDEANDVKSGLNSRFIMYQNLRGYVTDLVDCLRCKVPEIENLEQRMIDVMKSRRDRFAERRRQDFRDQIEEVAATINIMGGTSVLKPPPSNSERTRRAAEREGRRTRRRRLREKEMKSGMPHKDGLSSDDEEPDLEFKAYLATRENIVGEAEGVFEDVHEDFGTVSGILSRFEEWRDNDFDAYKESYAYMCLPKCVAPFVRLQLISWDPTREGCDFLKQPWMKALLSYSYHQGESVEELTTDPDSRLVPSVVEKVVLPWIGRIIEARWDPMSGSQTRGLVNTLNRLIDEYSISPNSKPMHSVMEIVLTRFKNSLENDIYVPIYAKSALANNFTPASVFLARQFWSSVKLLDNLSKWQGLLNDRPLQTLALDTLLARYTLLGIGLASDLSESAERAKGVVNVLPRAWLARESGIDIPNGLQQLNRCLVSLVQTTECTLAVNRIAIPEISNILKTIGFNDEAQIILRKYS